MKILFAVTLLMVAQTGFANLDKGNDLYSAYENCHETDLDNATPEQAFSCGIWDVYVTGAFDAYDDTESFCQPKGINRQQVHDLVSAYLKNHPESRHMRADILVLGAVKDVWPCDNDPPPQFDSDDTRV